MKLLYRLFLGNSPTWYKNTIIVFLLINPILLFLLNNLGLNGGFIMGWILLLQFIFTLALALNCYPLQPGGLLAIQALILNLTTPYTLLHEIENNLAVILLLVFMVAGIYFMKNLMLTIFTKLFLRVESKIHLSLLFCFVAAFLSAFLDALTVTAVLIAVAVGFYRIFHLATSNKSFDDKDHNHLNDNNLSELGVNEIENFKAFLRDILMHGVVGTALGGVCTLVGEPQNLLIANVADWEFMEFIFVMAPVTFPVFIVGMATCYLIERFKIAGFGAELPLPIKEVFSQYDLHETSNQTDENKMSILITGSSSFIGKKLITRLKQKKIRFIGIDSKKVNIKNCFKINICDKNLNKKIKHNIKSIIHLAAISNSKDCASDLITCYKNNVLGTINILNFAKKRGIKKIIFASSEWVYGNKINLKSFNKNLNINNIIDDYSLSKILCEKIISCNKTTFISLGMHDWEKNGLPFVGEKIKYF